MKRLHLIKLKIDEKPEEPEILGVSNIDCHDELCPLDHVLVQTNISKSEIKLADLPPIHPSHNWGPFGHFGEAYCECGVWTDDIERGQECSLNQSDFSDHFKSPIGVVKCNSCNGEWPCHINAWGYEKIDETEYCRRCKQKSLKWYPTDK